MPDSEIGPAKYLPIRFNWALSDHGMNVAIITAQTELSFFDMKLIDNNHTKLLARAMDAYSLRQKMTASNVANLDTPGYKRVEVSFEEELQRADESVFASRPLNEVNPEIVQGDEAPILEEEMMEMADTQMRVELVTRALRHNFDQIRAGITGRG